MASSNPGNRQQQSALRLLDHTVDGLVRRQRRRQYIRSVTDALFWGLCAAAVAVICLRLLQLSHSVFLVTVFLMTLAVVVAVFLTARNLPSKLAVAMVADEQLHFKQRLSTAWEYRQAQPGSDLTSTLALAAGGARLPSVSSVFPFELNLWGMLVPLAVCLLVLANMIELDAPDNISASTQVDDMVIAEGARLEAFARRMRQRAEREGHVRSLAESVELQQLGAAMKSAAIQREQALHRLQKLQRSVAAQQSAAAGEALQRAEKYHTDRQSAGSMQGAGKSEFTTLRDKLSAGQLSSEDLTSINRSLRALENSEFTKEQLERALDSHADGKSKELQRILDRLSEGERNLRDAEQLDEARIAILRSRKNLGEETEGEQGAIAEAGDTTDGDGGELGSEVKYSLTEFRGDAAQGGAGMSQAMSVSETGKNVEQNASTDADHSRVTLKPEAQLQEGDSFRSETWALPKTGVPGVNKMQLDPHYEQQVEAVLSKEKFPLHRKEFVRRYFLNLSTSAGQ